MKTAYKWLIVAAILICAIGVLATSSIATMQLNEANAKFTYKGKPIHPFLVGKFYNWMSDKRPPIVTTVDVASSFDTNEYQLSTIEKRGNWWFSEKKEGLKDITLYEAFGYRWLGRLANGCHVIEMFENGGGSGAFTDLLLIKFSEGTIMRDDKKDKQLLMTVVGTYTLGDRYDGDIKVYPDKVIIPPSKDQRGGGSLEKDVELRFPAK